MPVMLADLHGVTAQSWSVAMIVYGPRRRPAVPGNPHRRRPRPHAPPRSLVRRPGRGNGGGRVRAVAGDPACIAAIGFGIVLLIPIGSTVVSRLAPVELRGRYMGVWTLTYMGGYAMGPLLGGWALDSLGGRVSFALTAAVCVLGALLFPVLRRSRRARVRASEGPTAAGLDAVRRSEVDWCASARSGRARAAARPGRRPAAAGPAGPSPEGVEPPHLTAVERVGHAEVEAERRRDDVAEAVAVLIAEPGQCDRPPRPSVPGAVQIGTGSGVQRLDLLRGEAEHGDLAARGEHRRT